MPKFRTKPVVIEAKQWFPPGDDRHDPSMWRDIRNEPNGPDRVLRNGDVYQFSPVPGMGDDVFIIRTLEGQLEVSPGDWIITGVKGEKYPCKPDIFEATYEPVND